MECPPEIQECLSILVQNEYDEFGVIRFCNTAGNCDLPNVGFPNGTTIDCQVCAGDLCNSHDFNLKDKPKIKIPKYRPRPPVHGGGGSGNRNNTGNAIELFQSISRPQLLMIATVLYRIIV